MNTIKLTFLKKVRRTAARWDTAIPVDALSKTAPIASSRCFATLAYLFSSSKRADCIFDSPTIDLSERTLDDSGAHIVSPRIYNSFTKLLVPYLSQPF
jgi:hypothetical protein